MSRRNAAVILLAFLASALCVPLAACAQTEDCCDCCRTEPFCPCDDETPLQPTPPAGDTEGQECLTAQAPTPAMAPQRVSCVSPPSPTATLSAPFTPEQPRAGALVDLSALPTVGDVLPHALAARAPPTL